MNNKSVVFLYSGQGSHYFQMGRDLYRAEASFRHHLDRLDRLANMRVGVSVVDMIYDESKSKGARFDHGAYTSLAIFMIERALSLFLNEKGIQPDFVLGSSMGTYAAACQAGCYDEETAMDLVLSQAELLTVYCDRGNMIAILDAPENFNQHPVLAEYTEIAAVNFQSHYVVAVPASDCERVLEYLAEKEMVYQEIPVSIAYHSRWIDSAKSVYIQRFSKREFKSPAIPLICCADMGPLANISAESFWRTARLPIEFPKTIQYLESCGPHTYVDVGPSGTLATFLKRLLPLGSGSDFYSILTPYDNAVKNLNTVVSSLSSSPVSSL